MGTIGPVGECERLGGAATTAELRAAGATTRSLRDAVARGELIRARAGVYLLSGLPSAVVAAHRHRGVLDCLSAARFHGLWTLDRGGDEPVHVRLRPELNARIGEVRANCPVATIGRTSCGCVPHRRALLELPGPHSVGVVDLLLAVFGCAGEEAFFAALESALRQRRLDRRDRGRLRSALPRRAAWLVDLARSDADSGLESLLRLRLHRLGLTLATQVEIGGVGRVDFVIGDCLILEADGRTHDGNGRHRDRTRDAVAMALGFVTLRFDAAQILHDWPLVESAILAATARGLHRSPAGVRHGARRGS